MSKIKIILADDHVVVRQGLRALINQQKDMQVIGEADDGIHLLDMLEKLHPNVVLADVKMPNLNGADAAKEIRKRFPDVHVVMLSMHADRSYVERSLQAGASGYVLKEEESSEIFTAIRHAALGNRYLSAKVMQQIPEPLNTKNNNPDTMVLLTLRESEIFQLVAEGKTSGEIADILGISVRTVEGHRAHMMSKLKLKTHLDFVRFALKHGIIVEEEEITQSPEFPAPSRKLR
jgi:DNA-binding NarL/FixJ family response regulator